MIARAGEEEIFAGVRFSVCSSRYWGTRAGSSITSWAIPQTQSEVEVRRDEKINGMTDFELHSSASLSFVSESVLDGGDGAKRRYSADVLKIHAGAGGSACDGNH